MPAGSGGLGGPHAPSINWGIDWGRSAKSHNDDVRALHQDLQPGVDSLLTKLSSNPAVWGTAPDGTKYSAYAQENNGSGLSLNVRETLDDVSALFGCLQCFQNVDNSKMTAAQTQPWSPTKPRIPTSGQTSAFVFMAIDLQYIAEYCSLIVLELQNKPNDKPFAQSSHFAILPAWWKTLQYQDNNKKWYSLPQPLPVVRDLADSNPPRCEQGCYLYSVGYLYLFCGEMLNKQWSGSGPKPALPDISSEPGSVDDCMGLMKKLTPFINNNISQLTWQVPT
jgi:hypothetical protein